MITGRADPGGGPEHVFQLSRQLVRGGEVFIAAPNEHPYWPRYRELVGSEHLFEIPHRAFSWAVVKRLENWCRENEIDVVHSHGRAAGLYARLLSRRVARIRVHTPHGTLQFKSVKDVIYWGADVLLARRTDLTIAVARSEREQLRRRLFLRSRLIDIPNGVNVAATTPNLAPRMTRPLRLVHVTRFIPQKNTEMVLAIMASLQDRGALDLFHVDVLGDGPERAAIEERARAMGLSAHITFHGAKDSIAPYLASAYGFLTTSRWEGMPLAVLEALAAGVPVVASDIAGNNDVVTREVGRLFPLGEPALAASHLLDLAQDVSQWQALAIAAAERVRSKFSVERMAADTRAEYLRLLAPRLKRLPAPILASGAEECAPHGSDLRG